MTHWKVGMLVRRSAHQLKENTATKPTTGIVTEIYVGTDDDKVLQRWPWVHWHGDASPSLCNPLNVERAEEPTLQRDRLNEVSLFLHKEHLRTDNVELGRATRALDEILSAFAQ